jgi:hypothetical protein
LSEDGECEKDGCERCQRAARLHEYKGKGESGKGKGAGPIDANP